jgi:hypothetical protein
MIITDQFGFLPKQLDLECSGFKIYCVDNFHETLESIKETINKDGFIYPPMIYSAVVDPTTTQKIKRIPNSERPALLHKLPSSHHIRFETDVMKEKKELRYESFGFIIHLIGYVFGVRLQFHDWWFDGRIPFRSQHNITITKETLEKFFVHSISKFMSWEKDKQKLFINILHMHNRAPSYEWDWEQFSIEYMVFDACWKFSGFGEATKTKHKERIKRICTEYQLYQENDVIKKITNLRNGLFHESLWCGEMPCTAADNEDFFVAYHLRRLNHRLIPALLGYNSSYVKSNWTCRGSYNFD